MFTQHSANVQAKITICSHTPTESETDSSEKSTNQVSWQASLVLQLLARWVTPNQAAFVPDHDHPAKVSFHQPGPWTGQRTPSNVRLSRWGLTGVAHFVARFRCCQSVYSSRAEARTGCSNCNPTHSRPEFASQIPCKAAVTSWLKSRSTQEPWKPRKFESSYRFWIHIDTSFSGCKDKLQTTSQAQQRVVRLSHFLTKY